MVPICRLLDHTAPRRGGIVTSRNGTGFCQRLLTDPSVTWVRLRSASAWARWALAQISRGFHLADLVLEPVQDR